VALLTVGLTKEMLLICMGDNLPFPPLGALLHEVGNKIRQQEKNANIIIFRIVPFVAMSTSFLIVYIYFL
jgi:hypothetical protein